MTALAAARWDVRHAFRLHRFELGGFALLVTVVGAAAVGIAGLLDATGYGASCGPVGGNPPACESMGREFYDLQSSWVQPVQGLLIAVPFIAGLLVGPPLVARELERGTARLAWSLSPSRLGWFLARMLPVLAAVFALAWLAGLALDRLVAATEPWTDPGLSFAAFGSRGVVFAARVTFVTAIGIAAGAVLGRTLPTVLVTAVLGWVAITGGSWVHGRWLATEAIVVEDGMGASLEGALWVDQRLRSPDGHVLSWDDAWAVMPPMVDGEDWPPAGWTSLSLVVPGDRYPFVQAREVAALGLATLAFLGVAAIAVTRRRPG